MIKTILNHLKSPTRVADELTNPDKGISLHPIGMQDTKFLLILSDKSSERDEYGDEPYAAFWIEKAGKNFVVLDQDRHQYVKDDKGGKLQFRTIKDIIAYLRVFHTNGA